jgi:hypothetical protein
VAFLWPLSARPKDTVAYAGDSLATVYFLAENGRRLWSDPGSLFSAGIAWPHEHAALFEAHRLLPALLAAPLVAATSNPILAANLLGFLAYAFNAWSARRLGLFLGLSPVAAFGAGALFAFHTYAVLEQPRLNIILLGFIPLALVEVLAFARTGESARAWRAALLWLAQAYTENYSAIYGGALIVAVFAAALVAERGTGARISRVRAAFLPAVLVGLAFLPVVLVYARMDAVYDFRREAPYSMDLSHFFATQPGNLLYGKVGPPVRAQQQGAHFTGFLTLILAGFAVAREARAGRRAAGWIAFAALAAAALVLLAAGRDVNLYGRTLMPGPYGWLYDHVPLFSRTRIPERFSLLAMLPLALLAGRGADLVAGQRRVLLAALAGFLSLEHAQRFPWGDTLPIGKDMPSVYGWLKESDARAVVEAPVHGEGLVRMESVDMYFQLFHHKPVLAAYVSFPPLLTRILRQTAEELPEENALVTLAVAGVDTILYHQEGSTFPEPWASAEAKGVIERRAAFARDPYWLRGPGRDIVFRIKAPSFPPSAGPMPSPSPNPRPAAWRYRASGGRPGLAGDGDPDTQWILEDPIRGGESIEIGFAGQSPRVEGIAIPLTRREILPTRFDVEIRDAAGQWTRLAAYGPRERDGLVRDLMASPGRATLVLKGETQLATAIRLVASPGARSFDGWRLAEIAVLTDAGGLE